MQIKFQVTEHDYKRFLNSYFFKRNLVKRLALFIILSVWIGSFKESSQPFILSIFLLKASIALLFLFVIFVLIPYAIATFNINKSFNANLHTKPKTIAINDEGMTITVENENTFWKWETIKKADINDGYLFISLYTNKLYLIPSNAFSNNNERINFLGVLKNNIQKVSSGNQLRKIRNLHYWGLLGFIPNIGVITGIILIVKGFQYSKKSLILIGIADILFTVFFWIVLLPLLNPNGQQNISQMQINSLLKTIEFYKLQNGQYPDSLQQLLNDDNFAPIKDAIQLDKNRHNTYFNYEKLGDKYLLFSSGQDGIPNTADDLHPVFSSKDSSKIGLIKSN